MGNVYPHGRDRVECDIIDNEIMFTFERLRTSLSSQRGKKFFATAMVALFAIFMVMGSTEYAFAQGSGSVVPATTPAPAVTPTETTNNIVQSQANDRTSAACSGPVTGFICEGIASILGLVANLIGSMILLVISVLIAFAQYNGFSDAMPVVQGWIVVRDTTNMFFIIVLLLTAFATVIGRDEFHYEKVLPKLLLQAVLINFSKTLIQLLIDFSQVVMLTFVNAFAQSAAGNFVYALGLDKMMQFNPTGTTPAQFANIILAYGLAIFFMSIALGVVIILTCYLVYRIVALWITLILAPLAFFASALPEKLQRGMGAVTGEYWKRLTGLLTGGPVIAFFLWLTLAITQRSSQEANSQTAATGLSAALNLTRPSTGAEGGVAGAADSAVGATFGFITAIADSNHVISFVVGIALMLAALDTAVASAAAMGGVAGVIASKTKSLAKGVVKAPYTLGKGAVKGAARGARAAGRLGYNIADQQLAKRTGNSLSRRIGVAGVKAMGYASSVPLVGGAIRRTDKYQKAESGLTQFAGRVESRTKELTDADKKRAANLAGLARSGTEEQELLEIARAGTLTRGSIGMAYSELFGEAEFAGKLADTALNERLYKERKHEYVKVDSDDGLYKYYRDQGLDESTALTTAKAASEQLIRKELFDARAGQIKTQRQNAIDRGDKTKIEEYEKLVRSNPLLAQAGTDREKALNDLVTSPDVYKDVDEFTANSGEVVTAFMLKNGWKKDANGVISLVDEADWKKKKLEVARVNKNLHQAMEAQELFLYNSPGTKVSQLNQMQFKKNKSDGSMHSFAINNDDTSSPKMVRGQRVRSVNQEKALEAIKTEAGMNAANVMGAVSYGAPLSEVLNTSYVDSNGRGASDVVAESIAANMAAASNVLSEVTNATANYNAARKDIEDQYNFDLQTVGNDKQQIDALKKERLTELAEAKAKYEDIKENASRYVTEASRAMAPAIRAMQQIGADGVGPEARAKMLQEITKTDANGKAVIDLRSIYQQYGGMSGPHQDALDITLAAVLAESDRLRKIENSGKVLTKGEDDILKAGDQLRVDMVKKGQRLPPRLKKTLESSDNPSDQYPAA